VKDQNRSALLRAADILEANGDNLDVVCYLKKIAERYI